MMKPQVRRSVRIAVLLAVVLVGAAVGVYLLSEGRADLPGARMSEESNSAAQVRPREAAAKPPLEPESQPSRREGPSAEEIESQIDAMLEERAEARRAEIREEYSQRVAKMQRELEEAEEGTRYLEERLAEARSAAQHAAPEQTVGEKDTGAPSEGADEGQVEPAEEHGTSATPPEAASEAGIMEATELETPEPETTTWSQSPGERTSDPELTADSTPIAAPSSPPSDPFESIDRALGRMELGNIAFNAPRTMNLRDAAIIDLLLSLKTPINALKERLEAAGEREGARIRVSDRMEARLSGPNFAITAVTPEVQVVSRASITQWKWEIEPTSGP